MKEMETERFVNCTGLVKEVLMFAWMILVNVKIIEYKCISYYTYDMILHNILQKYNIKIHKWKKKKTLLHTM